MSIIDLAVFAVIAGLLLDAINSQEASLGDVKIDDGIVKVYYTDGSRNASWDSVCVNYGHSASAIGRVICRQLGFQDVSKVNIMDDLRSEEAFSSDTIFHGFDCGEDPTYSHILQCSHIIANTCPNSALQVTCKPQRLSDNPFDGQVRLCPPKHFPFENQSVSTGLVLIHLHQLKEWRGINQPKNLAYPLGSHEADSICRQLGYTGAVVNSAKPWNSTSDDYSSCYKEPNVISAAWFTTNDLGLHCVSKSQDCVGCCFQYPSTPCTTCTHTTDIVVTCTYDLTISRGKAVSGWSARSTTCSFLDKYLPHSACAQSHSVCAQKDIPLKTFKIVVGSVGSVAVLLFIILTIIILVATIRWCRRWLAHRHHQPVVEHDEN